MLQFVANARSNCTAMAILLANNIVFLHFTQLMKNIFVYRMLAFYLYR